MLKITGDINFSDGYFDAGIGTGASIASGNDPFAELDRKSSDCWIGNFECVCAHKETSVSTDRDFFIIEPEALSHVCHFNIYSVANNHVMQHGPEAYRQMLLNIESFGSVYVGSREKPFIEFEHQGRKVKIWSFSQRPENFYSPIYSYMPDYKHAVAMARGGDFRIAYVHWGTEFMRYPYLDQQQFAHWLIDSGFDLIVGCHPHVLQGYEIYQNKYIFYSLGNFVFNMAWEPTKYGAIVNVDLAGDEAVISYEYVRIADNFFPRVIAATDVPEPYRFSTLNAYMDHPIENELYYRQLHAEVKKYRHANYAKIMKSLFKMKPDVLSRMVSQFVLRRLNR